DNALARWNTQARPYLDSTGAGGYMLEGTSYGSGSALRIFWYLTAHASATGENLLTTPGFLWPREFLACKRYLTAPTRERLYPGGDQSRESHALLCDYDRSAPLV